MGQIALNRYVSILGGSLGQMVDGVSTRTPMEPVAGGSYAPLGYRNEFQIRPDGSLLSYARFVACQVGNLPGLISQSESWAQSSDFTLRTRFVVGPSALMLDEISVRPQEDHESDGFTSGAPTEVGLLSQQDDWGMIPVDVRFTRPPTSRIGVEFRGDLDDNDYISEHGKFVSWCGHILFDQERADRDVGLMLDSISIGGWTARDHAENLDPEALEDYISLSPRPVSTIVIWLGQNSESDEWSGGVLQPVWIQRIEQIADTVAGVVSAQGTEIEVVLVTPPQMSGAYPSLRFVAMDSALEQLAESRGWAHISLLNLVGASMDVIEPGYSADGVHPTLSGSEFVAHMLFQHLHCIAADLDGDGDRDFFDVSSYLSIWNSQPEQADLTGDGLLDFFDIARFLTFFSAECE